MIQMLTFAWLVEGEQADANFGLSLAGGDVNGDGFADLVVGAPFYDVVAGNEGRASLFLGSATGLDAVTAWTSGSDQADASLGFSVALGDVNGDGFLDVITGSAFWDDANGRTDVGQTAVYHGSAGVPDQLPAWTADIGQTEAYFGFAVASAGDVDADGFDDVIVGAPFFDGGLAEEGGAWLYRGSASGLGEIAAWSEQADQAGAQLGYSVASAGDVNGDGFDDVIVGSPLFESDAGTADEGTARVYLGSANGLAANPTWTAEGDQAGATFGWSVASAGDVNADGFGDVVVGALYYTDTLFAEGAAFVYLGSAAGLDSVPAWMFTSQQYTALFGFSVASAGDMNDDGFDDIAVGALLYEDAPIEEGSVFVFYGGAAGPSATPDLSAESDQIEPYFGYAVAPVGDTNGDGFEDLAVGAPWWDGGDTNEGGAFVYLGECSSTIDTDGDTVGDACDLCPGFDDLLDDDVDLVPNDCDLCPAVSDPAQVDDDGDGIGDVCDPCPYGAEDADADGWCGAEDCDDTDANTFPGAPELCDGADNTCAGSLPSDELDEDDDGSMLCNGECNDTDPNIHPAAAEICNGVDDDCDGSPGAEEADADGDHATVCAGDCDDGDPQRSPDFFDTCGDAIDNNCDGSVDETCSAEESEEGGCGCGGVGGASGGHVLLLAAALIARRSSQSVPRRWMTVRFG